MGIFQICHKNQKLFLLAKNTLLLLCVSICNEKRQYVEKEAILANFGPKLGFAISVHLTWVLIKAKVIFLPKKSLLIFMASLKNAILTNFWPKVGLDCYCNPFFWPSKNNAQKIKSDFFCKIIKEISCSNEQNG